MFIRLAGFKKQTYAHLVILDREENEPTFRFFQEGFFACGKNLVGLDGIRKEAYIREDPPHRQTLYEARRSRLLPSRTRHPKFLERRKASCHQASIPLMVAWKGSLTRRQQRLAQPARGVRGDVKG